MQGLAERTKIQKRYLERLEAGEFEKLPPAVYVKGFVQKWAQACSADYQDILLQFYRENKIIVRSRPNMGIMGIAPSSFIITSKHIISAVIFSIIAGVFIYFLLIQSSISNVAQIEIFEPSEFNSVHNGPSIHFKASIKNADNVFINDTEFVLPEGDMLEYDYSLNAGINTITIRADKGSSSVQAIRKVLRVAD